MLTICFKKKNTQHPKAIHNALRLDKFLFCILEKFETKYKKKQNKITNPIRGGEVK